MKQNQLLQILPVHSLKGYILWAYGNFTIKSKVLQYFIIAMLLNLKDWVKGSSYYSFWEFIIIYFHAKNQKNLMNWFSEEDERAKF